MARSTPLDLNCDVGELRSLIDDGTQDALIALMTRANIACGGHAGDDDTMARTVAQCRAHGVLIGAHPSYPDRENFGRARIDMDNDALRASLRAQVDTLRRVAPDLSHVKPHGALYHAAGSDEEVARVVLDVAGDLFVMLAYDAPTRALFPRFLGEAFADRGLDERGALLPRSDPRALLRDPSDAAAQALRLSRDPRVASICVHSDTPGALAIARAVRAAFASPPSAGA